MESKQLRTDLDERASPTSIAVHIERMLGLRCVHVAPMPGGSDVDTRLMRVSLPEGAGHSVVVCKIHGDADSYCRETRNLTFVNRLGDFAPELVAQEDEALAIVMEFIDGQQMYELSKDDDHELVLSVSEASLRMLAELHCRAALHIDELTASYDGQPPHWEPPGSEELVAAWCHAVSAAASAPEVLVPERELSQLAEGLSRYAHDSNTLVLFDVNPFNLLWTGHSVRMVDLVACTLGPAWLDLDMTRRMRLTEAEIVALCRCYLDHCRGLGSPIPDEEHFLTAADYWQTASALMAAQWFQERAEGQWETKPLPSELLRHECFRDDVLADVWAICHRHVELSPVARVMEQVLPPSICQERYLRRD